MSPITAEQAEAIFDRCLAAARRIPEQKDQIGPLIRILREKTLAYGPALNDESRFERLANDTLGIAADLIAACKPKGAGEVWHHRDVRKAVSQGRDGPDFRAVDRDELHDVVNRYLARPWLQTDWLELLMLDALVHFEVVWFSEKIKERALGPFSILGFVTYALTGGRAPMLMLANSLVRPLRWALNVALTVALPGWWIWYELSSPAGKDPPFWALPVAVLLVLYWGQRAWTALIGREEPIYLRHLRLADQMSRVYELLASDPVCPAQIRLELMESTRIGAVWDAQTWMLVESAHVRNPATWGLSPVWA